MWTRRSGAAAPVSGLGRGIWECEHLVMFRTIGRSVGTDGGRFFVELSLRREKREPRRRRRDEHRGPRRARRVQGPAALRAGARDRVRLPVVPEARAGLRGTSAAAAAPRLVSAASPRLAAATRLRDMSSSRPRHRRDSSPRTIHAAPAAAPRLVSAECRGRGVAATHLRNTRAAHARVALVRGARVGEASQVPRDERRERGGALAVLVVVDFKSEALLRVADVSLPKAVRVLNAPLGPERCGVIHARVAVISKHVRLRRRTVYLRTPADAEQFIFGPSRRGRGVAAQSSSRPRRRRTSLVAAAAPPRLSPGARGVAATPVRAAAATNAAPAAASPRPRGPRAGLPP